MRRQWFTTVSLLFTFSFLSLNIVSSQSQPGTINGTVKDPNGALVAGAQVTVRNEAAGETRDTVTDNQGRFKIEGLAPGGYKITINRDGFKTAERAIAIESGKTATVEIKLELAETRAEVAVGAKGSITPNADPNYRALRDGDLAEIYEVTNLTLKRDVGVITLRSGRVSFLPPVLGKVTTGVFIGDGEFTWFFSQWVYGIEVPRYKFDYSLTPDSDGKVILRGAVTQSDVSPKFKMLVPIYLDFGKGIIRLGTVPVMGNATTKEFEVKLPEKPKRVMINYHHDVLAYESVSVGK
jgi:Carboxypeptidase regulatory-like domain